MSEACGLKTRIWGRSRSTVPCRDPLDGAAANGAAFTSSMSALEIEMSCAQLALRADVGIHAGAFAADGCLKNPGDALI
jgi:hypothetical protein